MRLDPGKFQRYLCLTRAPREIRTATTNEDVDRLEAGGVQVLRLERRSSLSVWPWLRLYRLMVDESIDVLHAHMPRASVPGTMVGRVARVPVIVSQEHGWSFNGKPIRQFLDKNVVARGSDVLLAVSEWDRRHIIEIEGVPPDKVRVLHNGIAPAASSGIDVRDALGGHNGVALVGAVGRLYPEKNHSDLIRAVALLRDHRQRVKCVIVGDGPEEQSLRALIGELGVADQVQLVGRRQDVPDILRALDVAVLCSRHEGSPLALMEYMAAGAPIVATEVGGVPEMIAQGVHGLLVTPGDPAALASAIGRLLDDRPLALRLGTAASDRQRIEFDLDTSVRRLEEVYAGLCERSRRVIDA